MALNSLSRPDASEYAPYYERYTSLVGSADVLSALQSQMKDTAALLARFPEERAGFRYAPDKWNVREVVGHLIDGERIFAYRALRFSRNDKNPLPGFEQDDYVAAGPYDQCKLADLAREFALVRETTLCQFRNLSDEAWLRRGMASDKEVSVRGLAYIIAGHELHHAKILRERYLGA